MIEQPDGGAFEDIGYRRHMEQTQEKPIVYKIKRPNDLEIWRIERIRGDLRGEIVRMREDFARDLINRGFARRIN